MGSARPGCNVGARDRRLCLRVHGTGTGRHPFRGRDAIRLAWQPIFDDVHAVFEAEETFAMADRVVQRWRYAWFDGHIRGVDVFRIRDGLVCEKLSYVKG
jgi:SnoaL-like domain